MKRAFILLIALGVTLQSRAANEGVIGGAGTMSCGKIVTYLRDPEVKLLHDVIISWFQGYVSGRNIEGWVKTGDQGRAMPDGESIKIFVENYCGANPLADAYLAGDSLWYSMKPVTRPK